MKVGKKMVITGIVAAIILTICGVLTIYLYRQPKIFFFIAAQKADQMQVRLLCRTDHQALLEACRELLKQVDKGDLKPGKYRIRNAFGKLDPDVSRFPQVILDIEPNYVYIYPIGFVHVEMLGGLGHFGVNAFSEDFKPPNSYFYYGEKKLIDGLWYCDDGYNDNPEYGKRIDALLQKRK